MNQRVVVRMLNAASVVLLMLIAIVFVVRSQSSPAGKFADEAPSANIDDAVLLFALASDCTYCEQSYEFYRALLSSRIEGEFRAVAVFEEPTNLAREYLRSHDLIFDEVQQANFLDIGVDATPTIMLVDGAGSPLRKWRGLLPPSSQSQLAEVLGVKEVFPAAAYSEAVQTKFRAAQSDIPYISPEDIFKSRSDSALVIVDTRTQIQYEQQRVSGSTNLPYEDLSESSLQRLPRDSRIAILCEYSVACERESKQSARQSLCSLAALAFLANGFENVSIVTANLSDMEDAGFHVVNP